MTVASRGNGRWPDSLTDRAAKGETAGAGAGGAESDPVRSPGPRWRHRVAGDRHWAARLDAAAETPREEIEMRHGRTLRRSNGHPSTIWVAEAVFGAAGSTSIS